MTFDKQVKEAKAQRLQYKIIRDVIFIILGLVFLALSIFTAQKDKEKENKKTNSKTTITTTIKKTNK